MPLTFFFPQVKLHLKSKRFEEVEDIKRNIFIQPLHKVNF